MASFLGGLFGGENEAEAAAKNIAAANDYYAKGSGVLTGAFDPSLAALKTGTDAYGGVKAKYGAGTDLYLDALGVHGPEGTARAQGAFTNSPGYQAGIDQGLSGIARLRSLAGMGDSGGTNLDAMTFAQNAQNKEYGGWLSSLQGLVNPELLATAGVAKGGEDVSGLYQGNAANQIGLLTGQTQSIMGANNLAAQGASQGGRNLLGLAQAVTGNAAKAASALAGGE